uniref:Uncharacterized protein n=1 Tax=Glossina brevipalpis TaxID=37001 RepID=A0A1A9W4L4_9MUSC
MIPYALIIILISFTLTSIAASGISNKSLNINSSIYTRNENINRFATSLNYNITSILKTSQNLASTLRDKRDSAFELDPNEIERQNQITQQILTHYIERRLFPFSNVNKRVPSIAEILPKAITSTTSPRAISIATSPTYKRGLASSNNTRRKTYGQKFKNSTKRKYNKNKVGTQVVKQEEEQEREQQELDKKEEEGQQQQQQQQRNLMENYNEEEDTTEQPVTTVTYNNEYKNQDNHSFYYNNEWSGGRSFLLPYDIEDDVEHDVQEALQSVESEQYDQYYNNDIFQRDPKENEIDSGSGKLFMMIR